MRVRAGSSGRSKDRDRDRELSLVWTTSSWSAPTFAVSALTPGPSRQDDYRSSCCLSVIRSPMELCAGMQNSLMSSSQIELEWPLILSMCPAISLLHLGGHSWHTEALGVQSHFGLHSTILAQPWVQSPQCWMLVLCLVALASTSLWWSEDSGNKQWQGMWDDKHGCPGSQ